MGSFDKAGTPDNAAATQSFNTPRTTAVPNIRIVSLFSLVVETRTFSITFPTNIARGRLKCVTPLRHYAITPLRQSANTSRAAETLKRQSAKTSKRQNVTCPWGMTSPKDRPHSEQVYIAGILPFVIAFMNYDSPFDIPQFRSY